MTREDSKRKFCGRGLRVVGCKISCPFLKGSRVKPSFGRGCLFGRDGHCTEDDVDEMMWMR